MPQTLSGNGSHSHLMHNLDENTIIFGARDKGVSRDGQRKKIAWTCMWCEGKRSKQMMLGTEEEKN